MCLCVKLYITNQTNITWHLVRRGTLRFYHTTKPGYYKARPFGLVDGATLFKKHFSRQIPSRFYETLPP